MDVPLSIYLITFVLAFGRAGRRAGAIAARLSPILLVTLVGCLVSQTRGPLPILIPLHLAALASLALQCHARLADDRPLMHDARWSAPRAGPDTPLWTDEFSNILSVLRVR